MSISTNAVIIGLILGVLLGGALIVWRQRYRDVLGALLVVGILALAVIVTIYQVDQFRAQKAEQAQIAQSAPIQPSSGSGSSMEPPGKPPVGFQVLPPGGRGTAAPAVVHHPSAGNP
jgi:hypothetical protein